MFLDNSKNIRILNIDIHSEIVPTSIVLYKDSLNTYQFIFKLLEGDSYFIIPDSTKLTIKINGIEVPATEYIIADKYRGTIKLKLSEKLFLKDNSMPITSMANIITLEMYSETTFGLYEYAINIPITVTTGQDMGDSEDTGTTLPDPDMPSPNWNLTGSVGPGAGDGPDDTENDSEEIHLIFDGGSFF